MNLMIFLRLSCLLAFGWMVVALGAGALGVGANDLAVSTTFYMPSPSLQDATADRRPDGIGKVGYQLLDRTTGKIQPLTLPRDPAWSLISVSPWRDPDGKLEAVGRWVSRLEGQDDFCGLGLLTLPEMTVKNRITLDVLPTSKPCWVPGRPGEVLFTAGNGQLYRCNVADQSQENTTGKSLRSAGRNAADIAPPRVVTWEAQPPGSGLIYFTDPVWSSEPVLRRLVFVAMSTLDDRKNKRAFLPLKLWWLVMNDEGDAIEAAGPLFEPGAENRSSDRTYERLPSVVVGAGGKIGLVYLTSTPNRRAWQLRSAKVELDPATSRPRMQQGCGEHELAGGLALSPLVVSADGTSVYAMDASGHTVKHAIPR